MDMAKGIAALKTEAEVNQAIIDIQRTLLDAQGAAFADRELIAKLSNEKLALEKKMAAFDDWAAEKKRYRLAKSNVGTFTYELRPEFAEGEVVHHLCVTCFDNGRKSVLQGDGYASCHACGKTIQTRHTEPLNFNR